MRPGHVASQVIQFYEDRNFKRKGEKIFLRTGQKITILACWSNPPTWGHKVDVFPLVSAIPFGKKDLKIQFQLIIIGTTPCLKLQ